MAPHAKHNAYDVAIVGGGIIGSAIAFELLSAEPKLRVAVLDRQHPGREASWAAAGMLSPSPDSRDDLPLVPLAKESLRSFDDFVARVEETADATASFARSGALQIFLASHAEAERDAFVAEQHALGIESEPIAIEAARRMEPALGPEARAVAWLADEATVDPRLLTEATLAAAARRGAEIRIGVNVTALARAGRRITGVAAGDETIAAKHVVLAAGAFSASFAAPDSDAQQSRDDATAPLARVHPVRGQMLALRSASVRFERVLRSHRGYIVPRPDGRIIAGSTLEDAGFEKRVTPAGLHQILSAALELAPALAGAEIVETWSGLRPGTPDNLPILGAGDADGLFIATGHYRNGILLAPATAKLMAQWILRGQVEPALASRVGLENFSPRRFAPRASVARP